MKKRILLLGSSRITKKLCYVRLPVLSYCKFVLLTNTFYVFLSRFENELIVVQIQTVKFTSDRRKQQLKSKCETHFRSLCHHPQCQVCCLFSVSRGKWQNPFCFSCLRWKGKQSWLRSNRLFKVKDFILDKNCVTYWN